MKVSDFCSMATDKSAGLVIFDENPDVNDEVWAGLMEDFSRAHLAEANVVSYDVGAFWNYNIPFIRLNIDTSKH